MHAEHTRIRRTQRHYFHPTRHLAPDSRLILGRSAATNNGNFPPARGGVKPWKSNPTAINLCPNFVQRARLRSVQIMLGCEE